MSSVSRMSASYVRKNLMMNMINLPLLTFHLLDTFNWDIKIIVMLVHLSLNTGNNNKL